MLAYLSDVFTRKSVSMQGKCINILKCGEKLNAFKEKLHIWCRRVKRGNLSNFPSLVEMVDDDMCVKKLWIIWKYYQSHLMDILKEENWKLLKNGL